MAVCRVEKNKNYTTMSNYHLRDPNLSNKARGLLSTMLSLPDNWDYTTRGLAKICKDGVDGITAQLKELEQYGYLIRHRIRDTGGRIVDMEYIIYERPHTASPDTEKPYMVKPDMALPRPETPAQINIDKRSTDESNTDLSNIHSILSDEARPSVLAALETKRKEAKYRDIFLGGAEPTTLKELNQSLGKETIDTFNTGESRGREVSHSLNYQKLGKDLATIDELAVLDGGKCILQLRGVRPFMSNKYDITKHPNYKYLSDANPKNNFDIEKYLSTQLKTKPDEVYQVYEVDASDVSATA